MTDSPPIETFDPWMLRYLTDHIESFMPDPCPPPETTTWWTGDDFLELVFPAEVRRFADDRLLLVNGYDDPIWLGLPSREIKRPPNDAESWVPVSGLRFYGRGDLTEAQARRRCSTQLRAWDLPVPTRQDFIAAIRPILQKQCARIVAENKREEAKWEKDRAAWLREKRRARQKAEQEEVCFSQTPEGIAQAERYDAEEVARLTMIVAWDRVEREEAARTGKEPPRTLDVLAWQEWRKRITRMTKTTPEDVAQAKIIRARVKQEQAERDATRRQREWEEEEEELASLVKA